MKHIIKHIRIGIGLAIVLLTVKPVKS
jgi:hypothetical protein